MFDPDKYIYAYLTGNHNSWETREFIHWINESPANKRKFATILEYWKNTNEVVSLDQNVMDIAYQKLSQNIFGNIKSQNEPVAKVVEIAKPRSYKVAWLSIAASIALLLGVVYVLNMGKLPDPKSEVEVTSAIAKENPVGRRSQIFLPDGTKVWLNAESSLVYDKDFGKKHRNIDLEGEAYFDVEKNKLLPFKVNTSKLCVTALGTEFNVRSYKNEHSIDILLTEGKVEISDREHIMSNKFLTEGESLCYSKNEDKYRKNISDPDHLLAWKNGILSFYESSEKEVFKTLERWYGVHIRVTKGKSDHDWKYTSRFENEPLENVLISLGHVQKFDFKINDQNVSVSYKNQTLNMTEL